MKFTARFFIALVLSLVILVGIGTQMPVFAQSKVFTLEELSKNDGKDGHPSYYAYDGVVYDVSQSKLWKLGQHFGLSAGRDLTGKLEGAPHGEGLVKSMPVVGTLQKDATVPATATTTTATTTPSVAPAAPATQATAQPKSETTTTSTKWYESRIRIFGISLLGWTGILLGVTFVINFATCFALPWSHLPLPWAGSRPGKDALDAVPNHKPWASIHKPFAWATVILGVIHGILGLLQLLGIYL